MAIFWEHNPRQSSKIIGNLKKKNALKNAWSPSINKEIKEYVWGVNLFLDHKTKRREIIYFN